MIRTNPTDVFPVYEFRPLPGFFSGDVLRYNNGDWVKDDGETYDICFIGMANAVDDFTKAPFRYPAALYFNHSYQKNIIYKWCSGHWSAKEPRHPGGNAWHYALRGRTKGWGGGWGRDKHPNEQASRAGMSKMSSKHGCANGVGIRSEGSNKHIMAGLVRNASTKEVLTIPTNVRCMYCGDRPGS